MQAEDERAMQGHPRLAFGYLVGGGAPEYMRAC